MSTKLTCEIILDGVRYPATVTLPFTVGDVIWEAGEEYVDAKSRPKVFGPFMITGMNITLTTIGGDLQYYEAGEEDTIRPLDAFATKTEAQAEVKRRLDAGSG